LGLEGREHAEQSPIILDALEMHWARHCDAARNAKKTIDAFGAYLVSILSAFEKLRDTLPEKQDNVKEFLTNFQGATQYLAGLRKQLSHDLDAGVKFAEVIMNRQLAFAASGAMAQFDPCELAHAVRVMCRDSGRVRFSLILKALQVVASAQSRDGTWTCQQPFYWTQSGFALWTMSIDTGCALVSIAHMLLTNPDRYGAGLLEVTTGIRPVYDALDRFFRWLSGSMQSLPEPPALAKSSAAADDPPLYGWCSDRVPDSERIHSWATAIGIEFLVDFRRLLQERINAMLREEFLSYHPSELTRLSDVGPTDLRNTARRGENSPVIAQLMKLLREHKKLELAEGPWVPAHPEEAKPSFWSGLLYGPPGTSKTFLAKAIAGELGWPLISVSPSDFLAKGDAHIEPRAQEIFTAFSGGSRMVFFFDEIDELIRDRRQNKDQRSALSFLTPSFLAKLQDFRDTAERNEFIFILATNYKDRIDSAAIRSGRIDKFFPVVYPDLHSRAYTIIRDLLQRSGEKTLANQFAFAASYLADIDRCLGKCELEKGEGKFLDILAEHTGFLSYQKLRALMKLLPAKDFNPDNLRTQSDLKQLLAGEVAAIGKSSPGRYQPEISLPEYADRPEAFASELVPLTDVIPSSICPWSYSKDPSPRSLLEEQLEELFGKIADQDGRRQFVRLFEPIYEKHAWNKKPWLGKRNEQPPALPEMEGHSAVAK
jgi:hypothetical protein